MVKHDERIVATVRRIPTKSLIITSGMAAITNVVSGRCIRHHTCTTPPDLLHPSPHHHNHCPPPPPEPRPSPTQEMASAMMLTMVDYMRRRLDKQLARMSEDDKALKSSGLRPMTSQSMSQLGSPLPLMPLAPMPSPELPPSPGGHGPTHPLGKKHKKKTHKSSPGGESSSEEGTWVKDSRLAKQAPPPAVHAISKQGADIVEKLQSEISPDDKSDSSTPGDDEEGSDEESPTKVQRCPWCRCCCLSLWFVLLLAAFGVAIAYLLFPKEVGDVL
ncbi:hypothetical protein MTO96_031741, partial [Rhipicephalus appendiculatus]